jgi:hypothetical protein
MMIDRIERIRQRAYELWARVHAEWRRDGDWDEQHHWHDRAWWVGHRHDWVLRYHPDWR